jgi:hypothetical protein
MQYGNLGRTVLCGAPAHISFNVSGYGGMAPCKGDVKGTTIDVNSNRWVKDGLEGLRSFIRTPQRSTGV